MLVVAAVGTTGAWSERVRRTYGTAFDTRSRRHGPCRTARHVDADPTSSVGDREPRSDLGPLSGATVPTTTDTSTAATRQTGPCGRAVSCLIQRGSTPVDPPVLAGMRAGHSRGTADPLPTPMFHVKQRGSGRPRPAQPSADHSPPTWRHSVARTPLRKPQRKGAVRTGGVESTRPDGTRVDRIRTRTSPRGSSRHMPRSYRDVPRETRRTWGAD